MHSISAEMNDSVKNAIRVCSDVFSNDLKVIGERNSLPCDDSSDHVCDLGSVDITKDVTIHDLSNNLRSGDVENAQDGVNQEKQEQDDSYSNRESQISCEEELESSEAVTSVKKTIRKQNVLEPLHLRLLGKSKDYKKCNGALEPGSSLSLIMEVDEIQEDALYIEQGGKVDDRMHTFHLDDWDQHPFVAMLPDLEDTLLIDVHGIPYTLSPDGHKVPQVDTSRVPKINQEQLDSLQESPQFDPSFLDAEDADTDQELFLPNLLLSSSSEETVDMKSAEDQDGQTTSASSFSFLPCHIGSSNTEPSSPILLPSPSQLQELPEPVSPAPSIQSSSAYLGLSSQTPSEDLPSLVSGSVPSVSPVALSSSSGLLDAESEPVSCTTAPEISGLKNPCDVASSPTSPTSPTSSSTFSNTANQSMPETCSDAPTSFREALLRLAVSAEQKKVNQPKCNDESLGSNHSSCTEAAKHEGEHHATEGSVTPEQLDITDFLSKSVYANEQSSMTPVHPESALLPDGDESQALGPRRVLYCQYCPRIFYFLSDLERHSITHSQTKPHVCQWCDKAFKRSSHLERHKHIHTGERNFQCQLCPRRFREAAELSRHQRVHTGEKPYQCLLCHMRFSERNTLRRHTKRKHQGQNHEALNKKRKRKSAQLPEQQEEEEEEEEENAEWYSSAVPEVESDNDTGGE